MQNEVTLWDTLLEFYSEEEARQFLVSPQPFLGGMVTAEAMSKGGKFSEEVWNYLEGLSGQIAT